MRTSRVAHNNLQQQYNRDRIKRIYSDIDCDTTAFESSPHAEVQCERALWLAVIAQAGEDILKARTLDKANRVFNWFLSFSRDPGSFNWVCYNLGLHPGYWRKRAHELFERRKNHGGPFLSPKAIRGTDKARPVHQVGVRSGQPQQRDPTHTSDSGSGASDLQSMDSGQTALEVRDRKDRLPEDAV